MGIKGRTLLPLDERTGEWISKYEAALYLDRDPNALVLEAKKPFAEVQTKGCTLLVSRKMKGKQVEFTAESLLAFSNIEHKRGGFGRKTNAEGKSWKTSTIKPENVEAVKTFLAQFGVDLIDPSEIVKLAKARKLAEKAVKDGTAPQSVINAVNGVFA